MPSRVLSGATHDVDACIVEVETYMEKMIPESSIVGLPDSAMRESRERVAPAIWNSGFEFSNRKLTVNRAPADIKKEGSSFDLPMAIGLLDGSGQLAGRRLADHVLIGELALDGTLRPSARSFLSPSRRGRGGSAA